MSFFISLFVITVTKKTALTTFYSFLMSWLEEAWWFYVVWLNGLHFKVISKHCMALHYVGFFSNIFSGISCLFESSSPQKPSYYASKDFILVSNFWMALNNVLSKFRLYILLIFWPFQFSRNHVNDGKITPATRWLIIRSAKILFFAPFQIHWQFSVTLSRNYSLCNSVKI